MEAVDSKHTNKVIGDMMTTFAMRVQLIEYQILQCIVSTRETFDEQKLMGPGFGKGHSIWKKPIS